MPLEGEAREVIVKGSTLNAEEQTAYVATGSHGLAIVDASQFDNPIVLGQLDLSGDATDVAVDANLLIAAIASNSGWLQLVDVSDPMLPTPTQTVNIAANYLEANDGLAYVASSDEIVIVDLLTGEIITQRQYSGDNIDDMAIADNFLYTISRSGTSPQTINKIQLSERLTEAVDTLVIENRPTFGRLHIAAGGGFVYVGALQVGRSPLANMTIY